MIFRRLIDKYHPLCFVGLSLVSRDPLMKPGIVRHVKAEAGDMQLVRGWN